MWGCSAGVAFEAYEKGLLTKDDADGLELRWGDSDAVEKLMRKVAHRDGWLANIIAEGPKVTAEMIGGDAPKFAAHVRGGSPVMHDWRPYTANMLAELVNGGNQKPQCSGFDIGTGPGAPDLGRAINPMLVENQIMEGVIYGMGSALTEEKAFDKSTGISVNFNLHDYKILTSLDMPEIEPLIAPTIDPVIDNFGAKGVGEPGVVGVAATLANAIYNATSIRIKDFPLPKIRS